ncbi:MAG: hypothetical protein FWF01_04615 [Alphaproteobacteria bacterium]|nr:hypothetical protein [Alphaproteobacteria bacterium]
MDTVIGFQADKRLDLPFLIWNAPELILGVSRVQCGVQYAVDKIIPGLGHLCARFVFPSLDILTHIFYSDEPGGGKPFQRVLNYAGDWFVTFEVD